MQTNKTENLFAEERKTKILELLHQNRKITVAEICETYQVSPATARNDLRELESERLLTRTHGGAIVPEKAGYEPFSADKKVVHLTEKQQIAKRALALIDDGDTIILDTGTTILEFAKQLKAKQNLTVVTNDFETASVLENFETCTIMLLGGIVRNKHHCTVGPQGREVLQNLVVDKAIMSSNGFTSHQGATTPDLHHAETKRAMLAASHKNFFLCDHSKIGKDSFVQFATIDQVDTLITDKIGPDLKKKLEERDVEILIAS